MTGVERGFQHECDVLLRLVDSQLAILRGRCRGEELALAERIASVLRELVVTTSRASAADRARVRAAVHYFALREGRARRGGRSLAGDQRMINEVVLRLNRPDLALDAALPDTALVPAL